MIPVATVPAPLRRPLALLIGLVTGSLIYPIVGNWLWGGGWLASLGLSLGLGHGLVDFGGGGVLFLAGSVVSLLALTLLKPAPQPEAPPEPAHIVFTTGQAYDLSVYHEQPEAVADEQQLLAATPMPSAYLPILSVLGAGLMLIGWFGLAAGGHSPTALNFIPAQAAIGGVLAALSAALTAGAYSWFTTDTLNPLMVSRGFAAGLVLALPGAPFLPVWLLVAAGLLMGLFLPPLIYLFNQGWGLADELGVLATFGVSALAGLLLVALFATGQSGQGWNGVGLTDYLGMAGQGVSGLVVASGYVSDWPGQFQAQLLGIGAIILWVLVVAFLLFQTVKVVVASWARSGLELAGSAIPGPVTGAGAIAGSPPNPAPSSEPGLESRPGAAEE
jgi:Amt family ammonium transporter